ncbi:MAG TPA: hypothetical protein VLL52_05280 [Anaerolineae bacterium]|nr:hypothetical protein [Anaerolineae bacterium]
MSFLAKFTHKREMRESKDEIMVGEVVMLMAKKGCPAVGFRANMGRQIVTFKPQNDPLLHEVEITLDRKTGDGAIQQALLGNKAVISVQAAVKNYIADPDDLLNMYRTDMQNVLKIPLLGQVKLNHQMTTVYGTRKVIIEIDDYLPEKGQRTDKLEKLLDGVLTELKEKLAKFKK